MQVLIDDIGTVTVTGIPLNPSQSDALTKALEETPGGFACRVVKATEERRYTLGVAYGANLPDVGRALDGFRDFASEQTVQDAAWAFIGKSRNIGVGHLEGTDGSGTVVESYCWPADDWTTTAADGTTQTVRKGDWLLGVVWSPETWPLVKSGQLRGYSPQGSARRGVPSAESAAQAKSRRG